MVTAILYHQTSPECARKILAPGGHMKPGNNGYAGGGIYFAERPGDTYHKARNTGVVLSCKVDLGRVFVVSMPGPWDSVIGRGWSTHDSVKITSLNGVEYVVFDHRRVKSVRVWNGCADTTYDGNLKAALVHLGATALAYGYLGAWLCAPWTTAIVHAGCAGALALGTAVKAASTASST
ncbi:hypothetical protein HXX76_008647 [Chlamydomonas incerta]|uniref:PARP catalytic domain-containing protein n=1 Tax=Chlamydomonas incerta TaxID=51695 RepID=A0A835SWS8_CHLIN|nr:hypothetical protein HXX76_008647 [Chlamydomonas incerta]|eukprot:KAG2432917.1 hypothetical protein HXX76_008647 [Chlamydomonas incerta]